MCGWQDSSVARQEERGHLARGMVACFFELDDADWSEAVPAYNHITTNTILKGLRSLKEVRWSLRSLVYGEHLPYPSAKPPRRPHSWRVDGR